MCPYTRVNQKVKPIWDNFSSTDGEQMLMLLFDIVPLHNDALLVSFNKLLYAFEKEAL
jgi:hypothetical protein